MVLHQCDQPKRKTVQKNTQTHQNARFRDCRANKSVGFLSFTSAGTWGHNSTKLLSGQTRRAIACACLSAHAYVCSWVIEATSPEYLDAANAINSRHREDLHAKLLWCLLLPASPAVMLRPGLNSKDWLKSIYICLCGKVQRRAAVNSHRCLRKGYFLCCKHDKWLWHDRTSDLCSAQQRVKIAFW